MSPSSPETTFSVSRTKETRKVVSGDEGDKKSCPRPNTLLSRCQILLSRALTPRGDGVSWPLASLGSARRLVLHGLKKPCNVRPPLHCRDSRLGQEMSDICVTMPTPAVDTHTHTLMRRWILARVAAGSYLHCRVDFKRRQSGRDTDKV